MSWPAPIQADGTLEASWLNRRKRHSARPGGYRLLALNPANRASSITDGAQWGKAAVHFHPNGHSQA
jgi:hypothetical protein